MKLLGTVRSRLVFCGLATLAVVLLASGSAWMGYQAISAANENALRYANQATVLQTLIKDINQLITTEGAKAVRTRMADTLQRLDAELSAGGEAGASESGDARKKRLALWADLKVGVAALLTEAKISVENDEVLVKVIKLVTRLDGLAEEVNALASKSHDDGNALARQTVLRVGGLFALVLAVVAAMFVLLYRSLFKDLGGEPGYAREVAQRIADGELAAAIVRKPGDGSSLIAEMERMREKLAANVDSLRQAAEENLRIRRALDNVSTGVLIADPERRIIYANHSARSTLRGVESALAARLPGFSADQLIGLPMEKLHADSQARATLLDGLRAKHSEAVEVAGRHLNVTANPVIAEGGERLGSVAEWTDRTAEVTVEQEVAAIVRAAAAGDLGKRIDLQGKTGFFAALAGGLNQLLDTTESALRATSEALNHLAQGNLMRTMDGDYAGVFGQLRDDVNATVVQLREVVAQIKATADSIASGARQIAAGNQDLSARTDEQATALHQTTTSMAALTATVSRNAESVSRANALTSRSNTVALLGSP